MRLWFFCWPYAMEQLDLLTVKEVAGLLRISLGSVYALCKAGRLPHHRLGSGSGVVRIDRADLVQYAKQCKHHGQLPKKTAFVAKVPASLPTGFKHLRSDAWLSGQLPVDGSPSG